MNPCLEIMPHPYVIHEEFYHNLRFFVFQADVLLWPFHVEEYRLLACDGVLQVFGVSGITSKMALEF